MKKKTLFIPEKSVSDHPLTRRHIPEKKWNPHLHRCEKPKIIVLNVYILAFDVPFNYDAMIC